MEQYVDRSNQEIAQAVGEKVRARRLEGGLSLESVARVLGCKVEHLVAAESGQDNFTSEQVYELCSILRVKPSWFFDGIVDPN